MGHPVATAHARERTAHYIHAVVTIGTAAHLPKATAPTLRCDVGLADVRLGTSPPRVCLRRVCSACVARFASGRTAGRGARERGGLGRQELPRARPPAYPSRAASAASIHCPALVGAPVLSPILASGTQAEWAEPRALPSLRAELWRCRRCVPPALERRRWDGARCLRISRSARCQRAMPASRDRETSTPRAIRSLRRRA